MILSKLFLAPITGTIWAGKKILSVFTSKFQEFSAESRIFLIVPQNRLKLEANQNKNNIQFLQQTEIFRTFLRGKQVGEKHGRFQFVIEIPHKAILKIFQARFWK